MTNVTSLTDSRRSSSRLITAGGVDQDHVRLIAFYLPQFHPTPENDERWGKGFTEWRRVVQARPLFPGHYQPHLPADLGFYDLRLAETREAQAELASAYGIQGFCYYHYWFNGRRRLQRPFEEVLASGKPDFPFCLCWANENWTRAWEGKSQEIIAEQRYNEDDDREHIRSLIPAFQDPRYIRIDGKPLFLIYRSENFPDPKRTAEIWRKEAIRAGIGDIYLARVESYIAGVDPREIGFDGAVEFAPDWRNMGRLPFLSGGHKFLSRVGLLPKEYSTHHVADYAFLMQQMLNKPWPEFDYFRGVTPGFDNAPRRNEGATIFVNSSPDKYERWLHEVIESTKSRYQDDRRVVFVNAWNEWGEGNHLEPDQKFGRAFLEATARAVSDMQPNSSRQLQHEPDSCLPGWKKAYWRGRKVVRDVGGLLRNVTFRT